jgi:hypothetical protein
VDVDLGLRLSQGSRAEPWVRGSARGRHGSVRQELAAGVTTALPAAAPAKPPFRKAAMRLNEQSRGRDHESSDEGGQTRKQHEVAQEHTHTRPHLCCVASVWHPKGGLWQKLGFEGIVSKRLGSSYVSGRSRHSTGRSETLTPFKIRSTYAARRMTSG